jgi:anti-anti-sigma factor
MDESRMPLLLFLRRTGPVAIVEIRGALTLSPNLRTLKKQLAQQLTPETTGLVLNLARAPVIDSAGLGELVAIYASAQRRGIRIALAGASPAILELLRITRLQPFFALHPDEASAVAALS